MAAAARHQEGLDALGFFILGERVGARKKGPCRQYGETSRSKNESERGGESFHAGNVREIQCRLQVLFHRSQPGIGKGNHWIGTKRALACW